MQSRDTEPELGQQQCNRSSTSRSSPARRFSRRLRDECGVVLVEFAVVLPVLLLIILGIIDFGRFINYSDQESQMAAQAARWAAVNVNPSTSQTLQNYSAQQAGGGLRSSGGDVTSAAQVYIYYPTGSSNAIGNPIRARVVT